MKPPPFYRQNPAVWFRQIESQFVLAQVTNEVTKFHHIMAHLPEDVALNLDPSVGEYAALKELVLQLYQRTRSELMEEALGNVTLDGQKPSLCVVRIKRKLVECHLDPDDDLIKHKLLQAMPFHTRAALAGHQKLDLTTFASIADSVLLLDDQRTATAAHVSHDSQRQSSYQSTRSNSLHPFHPSQRPQICRAHVYYGNRARTCKPWCKWPLAKPSKQEPSSRPPSRSGSPALSN